MCIKKLIKSANTSKITINPCKCSTCQVLTVKGCSDKIHTNGHKIWYVMHSIVENIPCGHVDKINSKRIWETMTMIISSINCSECRINSMNWISTLSPDSGLLPDQKESWMFEVWKHHNDVNNRISTMSRAVSWREYIQEYRLKSIICAV